MFPYFGGKRRTARRYPKPEHSLVIEPFAGSCAYSLHWRPERFIATERDARVVELWAALLALRTIPTPPPVGSKTRNLLHKIMTYSEHALHTDEMTVTSRMVRDWGTVHQRILDTAPYVWGAGSIWNCDWSALPDVEATWFIDPPYQKANRRGYRFNHRNIDYAALGEWCRTRRGLVIVCEQEGADWLPFRPFVDIATHRGRRSREVIWTNEERVSEELAEGRAWAEELGMGDPEELEHIATTMFGCPPAREEE